MPRFFALMALFGACMAFAELPPSPDALSRVPGVDLILFLQSASAWETRRQEQMRNLFGEDFPTTNAKYGPESIRLVMVPVLLDLRSDVAFLKIDPPLLGEIRSNYLLGLSDQVAFFTQWAEAITNRRLPPASRSAADLLSSAREHQGRHLESLEVLRTHLGLSTRGNKADRPPR
ncbi:MAG: hypothetical protein J0L75_13340 [Spirochaetes bacterium]|nr:hypothetical protein [Spirochaetota bacterium]